MIAQNLDDLYRNCDPDFPLPATDERYVDLSESRGTGNLVNSIARSIRRSRDDQYHQILLTGHRGSGKSTELFRLKQKLESNDVFTIYIDTEDQLDIGDINYLDVLLCIAKEVYRQLDKQAIQLNSDLLNDLVQWFADRVIEDKESIDYQGSIKAEVGAKAPIPFLKLLAKLTAEIKAGSSRRETTRLVLEKEKAVFIQKLNTLIDNAKSSVKRAGKQDLVLIIDGLEKMPYRLMPDGQSIHAHLFVHNAEQLKAPNCHIIYTVPISLIYSNNLLDHFGMTEVIPMVKLNEKGIEDLKTVIAKRANIELLFENPSDIDELIKLSGGVMRDLIHLLRECTDTDEPQISTVEVQNALKELTFTYDRLVKNNEIEALRFVAKKRRATGEEEYARLLHLRLVLEYRNGEPWADVHPAVKRIKWVKQELEKTDIIHE